MTHSLSLTHRLLTAWVWQFLPRGILRLLPSDSRRFGPPRRHSTWLRYAQKFPSRWIAVSCPEEPVLGTFFDSHPQMGIRQFPQSPTGPGIAILPGGRIFDRQGWTIGQRDTFLGEFHERSTTRFCLIYGTLHCRNSRKLSGRTLNLNSTYSTENFFHWMMHAMGRAALFLRAGYCWDDVDHICIPALDTETTRTVKRLLQLPAEKLVTLGWGEQAECEELWQPTLPGHMHFTSKFVTDFHRQLLPVLPRGEGPRRLFLSRVGNRIPTNLPQLNQILAEHGFVEAQAQSFSELRQLLADATHIVAIHGAALTNLVYCQPGTRILEVISTDNVTAFYSSLCIASGLEHGLVRGRCLKRRAHSFILTGADFELDPTDVRAGLASLLQSG